MTTEDTAQTTYPLTTTHYCIQLPDNLRLKYPEIVIYRGSIQRFQMESVPAKWVEGELSDMQEMQDESHATNRLHIHRTICVDSQALKHADMHEVNLAALLRNVARWYVNKEARQSRLQFMNASHQSVERQNDW